MAQINISNKHLQISKANTMLVVTVAVAAFVTTFSLVATRAILAKRSYQSRVIAEKTKASDTLKANIEAVDDLKNSYQAFINQQENIIGGSSAGQGERDGDNTKIILDALPSSYDFPALTTTLEKILNSRNLAEGQIVGTDDEVAQKQSSAQSAAPVDMPFTLSVSGSYPLMLDFLTDLDLSIRPIHITSLQFSGDEAELEVAVDAQTYYQPEKKFNVTKKTVE